MFCKEQRYKKNRFTIQIFKQNRKRIELNHETPSQVGWTKREHKLH